MAGGHLDGLVRNQLALLHLLLPVEILLGSIQPGRGELHVGFGALRGKEL